MPGMAIQMTEKPLTIFNQEMIEPSAIQQIENCLADERAVAAALMGDAHLGYAMPIGGVVAYEDAISPTGVGFDIGCGNKAVKTNISIFDLGVEESSGTDGSMMVVDNVLRPLMYAILGSVSFGIGRKNPTPIQHSVLEEDIWGEVEKQFGKQLHDKARDQLGTVGSGNHYVDILVDESGKIWVANHFGSRGLGHTIASGFMAAAAGKDFTDRVPETEDSVVLSTKTDLGQFYVEAMELAGRYAYAGRDYVIDQVLNLLGAEAIESVHNHHNFAWQENGLWVVRKGATPLTTAPAYIGGSMGQGAVIVRGLTPLERFRREHGGHPVFMDPMDMLDTDFEVEDLGNLGSAPHGSGRVMSRTQAAGKMRKMWYCNNRNCDFEPFRKTSNGSPYPKNHCSKCDLPLRAGRMRDKTTAAIDWNEARKNLNDRGIVVLGAGADESPGVYKDLATVLAAHPNIEILHTLHPLGVVMAGDNEFDPYKD